MVGTEKTGTYVGVATSRAQVGFRDLGNGSFRVRVEPVESAVEELKPSFAGWKSGVGGSEFRFSTVVRSAELQATVAQALKVVGTKGRVVVSEGCPQWVVEAVKAAKPAKTTKVKAAAVETEAQERERLIAAVKAKKLPGYSLASRWSTKTLRAKAA
jgi:hypothetical protein